MRLSFRLKHRFFNAFREFFVHHHGSLTFRAKIFALLIASNLDTEYECYELVKIAALNIYKDDKERIELLIISIQELVDKVHKNNGLNIDSLIDSIVNDLKFIPRYAKKIDIDILKPLVNLTKDQDTLSYQENILEFLQNLKENTLNTKKNQIAIDEKKLATKY